MALYGGFLYALQDKFDQGYTNILLLLFSLHEKLNSFKNMNYQCPTLISVNAQTKAQIKSDQSKQLLLGYEISAENTTK